MMNYLRMDLKRLIKTRSFYMIMLVAIAFLAIFALASYYVTGIAEEFVPGSERMLNDNILATARSFMTFNFFFSFFFSVAGMRMLHMLLSLFAAGYLSKEHQSGYLKNLFCIKGMRTKWMISKTLSLLLATLAFYAVFALACVVVLLLYGNPVVIHLSEVGPFLLGQVMVDMALYAIIMLALMLFQSKAASVVIALILSLNMQALLYLLIDWVNVLPFRLSDYGLMNLAAKAEMPGSMAGIISEGFAEMGQAGAQSAAGSGEILLPVAISLFVFFTLLSALALRRVDYKG